MNRTRMWAARRQHARRRLQRRGSILVYMALTLLGFLGIAAIVVDMGYFYTRKAEAQKAADAGALAGAYELAQPAGNDTLAYDSALKFTEANGYKNGSDGVNVTAVRGWQGNPNWYHVEVSRPEPVSFAGVFGIVSQQVRATATATFSTQAGFNISGGGTYGQPNGPVNLSMFGPDGWFDNGDSYSTRFLVF